MGEEKIVGRSYSLHAICNTTPELQLMEEFILWEVVEIREAFIKRMSGDWFFITPEIADWAEKTIIDLLQQRDDMGEKLLRWYLFDNKLAKHCRTEQYDKYVVRALGFTINMVGKVRDFSDSTASKYVAGVILKGQYSPMYLYEQMPFMKDFLARLILENLAPPNRLIYFEKDWHMTERALKIIIKVGDFSFLSQLENLVLRMETGNNISIGSDLPVYALDSHIAILKRTILELRKIQEKLGASL